MDHDVYLYGSVLITTGFLLGGDFPRPDGYAELERVDALVSGESGIAAAILSEFGCRVKVDGYHLGRKTAPIVRDYFSARSVDISAMTYDDGWDGLEDFVIIDKVSDTRTCLGSYGHFYANPLKRYNQPDRADIGGVRAAGIDPFNADAAERGAQYCRELDVPYVTMDCAADCALARHSAVNVLSSGYLKDRYKDDFLRSPESVLRAYTELSGGLVIFTFGGRELLFGRRGETRRLMPYPIKPVSTLGAGDSFKAACIYGLYQGMPDAALVDFACAVAGTACARYPLPLNLPTLPRVKELQATREKA
jgi:sugar/nucleoside kinase (ribokinase family)